MKTLTLLLITLVFAAQVHAQKTEEKPPVYKFTVEKEVPHTSIKNQASSGTCWSFSGLAFLESEMMRQGKDSVNFSPMWVVRNIYHDKVVKFVRMHGNVTLAGGGSFSDVTFASKKYGIIPTSEYEGLNYGDTIHKHDELDRIVENFGKSIIKGKKLTTAWTKALDNILDAYLGEVPKEFTYNGAKYSPLSFAQSTGLNIDNYVSLTSFTHHPFYTSFILEIPDNWIYESSYNLPVEELMQVIENAVEQGYAVAWGTDVSEKGFSRNIARVPVDEETAIVGSDQDKWTKESEKQKGKAKTKPEEVKLPAEKTITQQMRQEAFDNYETTDDHGMEIVGLAKDKDGNRYYKVKNSWGTAKSDYEGYLFASKAFVEYKTMNIMVNKNAIPQSIRQKLKL